MLKQFSVGGVGLRYAQRRKQELVATAHVPCNRRAKTCVLVMKTSLERNKAQMHMQHGMWAAETSCVCIWQRAD